MCRKVFHEKGKVLSVWAWTAYAKGMNVGFVGNNFFKIRLCLINLP